MESVGLIFTWVTFNILLICSLPTYWRKKSRFKINYFFKPISDQVKKKMCWGNQRFICDLEINILYFLTNMSCHRIHILIFCSQNIWILHVPCALYILSTMKISETHGKVKKKYQLPRRHMLALFLLSSVFYLGSWTDHVKEWRSHRYLGMGQTCYLLKPASILQLWLQ